MKPKNFFFNIQEVLNINKKNTEQHKTIRYFISTMQLNYCGHFLMALVKQFYKVKMIKTNHERKISKKKTSFL